MRRSILFFSLFVLLSLALGACHGDSSVESGITGDAGDVAVSDQDGRTADDAETAESDVGGDARPSSDSGADAPPGPCEGVSCGTYAHCDNGQCVCDEGYAGDPSVECQEVQGDPCEDVQCDRGATCVRGTCACDPGFSPDGAGGCGVDPVSDPATRSRQEVCDRWLGYGRQASSLWQVEPTDDCDWGVLNPEAQRDALRRLTLFRWLVGLGPVTSNTSQIEVAQACATTLAAENAGLTHHIPSDYACYTQEAASGASSSNIAMGVNDPASTVDLYVADYGVPSLGHRRWCLNPSMGTTGFGHRGRYGCMYSFDRSASSSAEHVLYPSAGYFPKFSMGSWSAGSSTFHFGSDPEVTITRVSDGSNVQVDNVKNLPQGYGPNTISWQVPSAETDVEYEVSISNGSDTLSYRTTLVDCR